MIEFWFTVIVFIVIVLGVSAVILVQTFKNKPFLIPLLTMVSAVVIGGGIFIGNWWLNNTASGLRTQVSWRAEIELGLNRSIQVFTATGTLVYEYSGRFDVEQNAERIVIDIIDDEMNSRRVYISAPAGVVIISEQ